MTPPTDAVPPEQEPELRELLDAVCEDRLTPEITTRLETALRDRPAAQEFYLRHLHLHGLLKWELGQEAEWSAVRRLKEQRAGSVANVAKQAGESKSVTILSEHDRYPKQSRWIIGSSIAATLLVTAVLTYWMSTAPPQSGSGPMVALPGVTLSQVIDARWDAAHAAALRPGDSLSAGEVRLAAGLARLDFADGASVTLEGPTEFTVVDGRRGILHRGRLTAKVPPEAIGFRIDTPTLTAVDLGTTFGIQADDAGRSEIQVFDGEVALSLPSTANEAAPQKRTLTEGTAARADADRRTIAETSFDGSAYVRSWPLAYGVLAATGSVRFVEPKPHLVPRRYEDDAHLVVFPEREAVVLPADLRVAAVATGRHAGPFDPAGATLRTGTRVRSYLMQFNPVGASTEPVRALRGSITFDRPIVGLICNTKPLAETDPLFSFEPNWRAGRGGGGIENGDVVTLSEDRRTLTVDLTAAAANDQLRVLVEAAGPVNEVARR